MAIARATGHPRSSRRHGSAANSILYRLGSSTHEDSCNQRRSLCFEAKATKIGRREWPQVQIEERDRPQSAIATKRHFQYIMQHPRNKWRRRGQLTASMVGYRINTPALNGGAAEQPTLFKVFPEATAPEEEEEVKIYQKGHPVKGCQNGWRRSYPQRHPYVTA